MHKNGTFRLSQWINISFGFCPIFAKGDVPESKFYSLRESYELAIPTELQGEHPALLHDDEPSSKRARVVEDKGRGK